jgi:flagellar protein FliS
MSFSAPAAPAHPAPASYAAPMGARMAPLRPAARPAGGASAAGGYGAATSARYRDAELATATPGQLVVMLFDKCLLTVRRAAAAFTDPAARAEHVCRAADMLAELRASLDFEAGDGGALSRQLDALYAWAGAELYRANREQAPERLEPVLRMVGELRDAFAGAQAQLAAQGAPSAPAARSA